MPISPPWLTTPDPGALAASGGPRVGDATGVWRNRLVSMALGLSHPAAVTDEATPSSGGSTSALASAVASIVAVAAQRALAAGDLAQLRALVERALDAAEPAHDDGAGPTGLPAIADADTTRERRHLLSLMERQSRR